MAKKYTVNLRHGNTLVQINFDHVCLQRLNKTINQTIEVKASLVGVKGKHFSELIVLTFEHLDKAEERLVDYHVKLQKAADDAGHEQQSESPDAVTKTEIQPESVEPGDEGNGKVDGQDNDKGSEVKR